jgi:hypothetical protein
MADIPTYNFNDDVCSYSYMTVSPKIIIQLKQHSDKKKLTKSYDLIWDLEISSILYSPELDV